MASTTFYVVIFAVIGCCFAQKNNAGICKPSPHHMDYAMACIKETKGLEEDSKVDYNTFKDLSEDEKKDMFLCISHKDGTVNEDRDTFYRQEAMDNTDASPNTDEVKQGLKAIIAECCQGDENEYPVAVLLECIMPQMKTYCKCSAM